VSVIVSLIVLVMGSSQVVRPAAQWYAAKVLKACSQRINLEVSLKEQSGSKSSLVILQSY